MSRLRKIAIAAMLALVAGSGTAVNAQQPAAVTTITVGLQDVAQGLSPLAPGNVRNATSIIRSLYSSLVNVDPSDTIVGDLATSWEIVDPTHWKFTLRPDVKFSDGSPLDAHTVVWNFTTYLVPGGPYAPTAGAGNLKVVASAEALDDHTVVLTLTRPEGNLISLLTTFYIRSPAFIEGGHDDTREALGSGPYQLVSFDSQTQTVTKANPLFYGKKPEIENVIWKYYPDDASRLAAVQSGDADVVIYLNPQNVQALKNSSEYNVGGIPTNRNAALAISTTSTTNPALHDLNVRQALNYGIDKSQLTDGVFFGAAEQLHGSLFSTSTYGIENPSLNPYAFDPAKAAELLAASGYTVDKPAEVTLQYIPGRYVAVDLVAQNVADQYNKIPGLKVTIQTITLQKEIAGLKDFSLGVEIGSWSFSNGGWRSELGLWANTFSQNRWIGPRNDEYTALLVKLAGVTDPQQAQDIFNEATRLANEEAVIVPLYSQPLTYAVRKTIDIPLSRSEWLLPQLAKAGTGQITFTP